ncbi:MAG: hypothetical protein QHH07_10385 [Sedimentisphaerales bacterium]|nr:hypothetical protein [Sedimentisphaerales bacterium]
MVAPAGAAVGLGVMMPAIFRARKRAPIASSAANLRSIALALIFHANEHDNRLPDTLEQAKDLFGSTFPSARPDESPRRPKDFAGPAYIYVPGHTLDSKQPHELVLLYENPEYCSDGVIVAFLDENVEFMRPEAFMQALSTTYERLGRPMPQIRFKGR